MTQPVTAVSGRKEVSDGNARALRFPSLNGYLLESLYMLFENRLGWEIYRPIGTEWYSEGYWLVFDAMDTAEQYLGLRHGEALKAKQAANPLGDDPWKNAGYEQVGEGLYEVPSMEFAPRRYRAITLEAAKATKWDYVLSSTPDHFPRIERFRREYCPTAKHLWQSGNPWSAPEGAKNILNSTAVPMPPELNTVYYHQEFDATNRFIPDPTCRRDTVANLLHYGDLSRFDHVAEIMPEMRFLAHGAGNRDRSIPEHIFRDTLRHEVGFLWHAKRDDGFGFNIHTAAACGKPLICNASALAHQKAGPLLIPGETAINLDALTDEEVAREVRRMRDDYPAVSARVRKRFEEVVDFEDDFRRIKEWLSRAT